MPSLTPLARAAALIAYAAAGALAAGCATVAVDSHRTKVESTWKDPRYAGGPMRKLFVLSLMKVEPGGRAAVENALVARLASAGVTAVAAHTVMARDAGQDGPALEDAIRAAGADGVLLVQVQSMGVYTSSTVGATFTTVAPDKDASYGFLKREGAWSPGTDYMVAKIVSELYLPSMGKQVWTAFTESYDASDLARNLPDYTLKLVTAMAREGMIPAPPKPAS